MADKVQEMRKKHLNYLFLNTGTKETPAWVRGSKSTDFAKSHPRFTLILLQKKRSFMLLFLGLASGLLSPKPDDFITS